jgi:hypothetical protein
MLVCMAELLAYSIDAKKLEAVEAEIKATGGEVISVAGDVGADDFPKKIVDATVKYAHPAMLGTILRLNLTQSIRKDQPYY